MLQGKVSKTIGGLIVIVAISMMIGTGGSLELGRITIGAALLRTGLGIIAVIAGAGLFGGLE